MFKTADTRFDRITRLRQLLDPPVKLTMDDHKRIQHDALSLRALTDLPAFRGWTAPSPEAEHIRSEIAAWDGVHAKDSRAAALYEMWRSSRGGGGRGAAAAAPATRLEAEAWVTLMMARRTDLNRR